ncbi:hypothetical protein GCM10008111_31960 [Alishewanella tabrizica]|uniref:DUF1616 domain-containing protein n=1 Tax=Alishewanella tabrizica TaxID=671278 RepID=A0ABQ2WUN3_9ALTE|nr:hypothetical protein GCM10008111_31960 [Alishewanella tabrizica]
MGYFPFLLLVMVMPLVLVPVILLPALLLLRARLVKSLLIYIAVGASVGGLLGGVFSYSFYALSNEFNSYYVFLTLVSVLMGAAVSFFAWRSVHGRKVV